MNSEIKGVIMLVMVERKGQMMAGDNKSLNKAKTNKEDEFYTQLTDIEKELRHYRKYFKGKTIMCNCDDPFESNFFKYFVMNFNRLKIKKLISTCYDGSAFAGTQFDIFSQQDIKDSGYRHAYKATITKVYDKDNNGYIDMEDIKALFLSGENELTELQGNGDYQSDECVELLDEADIVVTNPPFSEFRRYIAFLLEHEKSFLILANDNAITYKEVFPLLRDGVIWLGYYHGYMAFRVPDYYEPRKSRFWIDEDGQKWRSFGNMCWFTNLDVKRRHEDYVLTTTFEEYSYPHYDNYDAIDVEECSLIPCDYTGIMGVPHTIFHVHNPEQFEIIGFGKGKLAKEIGVTRNYRGRCDIAYTRADGSHHCPYGRILVRNKNPEILE